MAQMNDLISRSALFEEVEGIYKRHYEKSCYQFIHDFFRAILRLIRKAPAVDAVPVVRCKDCRIGIKSHILGDGWIFCTNNQHTHKDSHFCSYGERRSGDGNEA